MTSFSSSSSDTWIYDHQHSVYFHPLSNTYAIPDPTTGQWSYLPAAEVHSASTSTSTSRNNVEEREHGIKLEIDDKGSGKSTAQDDEKEEGEIEDDVGWGGLMDPDKLDKITKEQSVKISTNGLLQTKRGNVLEKHPAYTVPYDDPALYAFPSDHTENELDPSSTGAGAGRGETPNHLLRLVVLSSKCVQVGQLAVIDTREDGVQIGRDRCEKGGQARVRLREMEVSKTHAVIYWGKGPGTMDDNKDENEEEGWWVVDLGSTHGTFLTPSPSEMLNKQKSKPKSVRLSEPKHSSQPHRIHHLSLLRIGSTTVSAHLHPSWPCDECKLKGDNEIVLDDGQPKPSKKDGDNAGDENSPEVFQSDVAGQKWAMDSKQKRDNRETKRKREMALLREALLNRDSSPSASGSSAPAAATTSNTDQEPAREYLDRSAMRRRLHPPSRDDWGSTSHPRLGTQSKAYSNRSPASTPISNRPTPASTPPAEPAGPSAFATSLLAQQGWTPGQGLGKNNEGRAEAVEAEMRTARRGLGAEGSKAVLDVGEGDWKMRGKQRRWEETNR